MLQVPTRHDERAPGRREWLDLPGRWRGAKPIPSMRMADVTADRESPSATPTAAAAGVHRRDGGRRPGALRLRRRRLDRHLLPQRRARCAARGSTSRRGTPSTATWATGVPGRDRGGGRRRRAATAWASPSATTTTTAVPDIYVNNFGPNVLYRNNGDGTFTDVTAQAGVAAASKVGAGACFLDIDGDGDLDLYVANYVDFTYENHVQSREHRRLPSLSPAPTTIQPVPDTLFRNNGDGTFTDVSAASGIGAVAGAGMGMVCGDYDNDGDTDIFVCNDVCRKLPLPERRARASSQEVGLPGRRRLQRRRQRRRRSMGVDCGDYDNDGWLDFFVTDYSGRTAGALPQPRGRPVRGRHAAAGAGRHRFPARQLGLRLRRFRQRRPPRPVHRLRPPAGQRRTSSTTGPPTRSATSCCGTPGDGHVRRRVRRDAATGWRPVDSSRGVGLRRPGQRRRRRRGGPQRRRRPPTDPAQRDADRRTTGSRSGCAA